MTTSSSNRGHILLVDDDPLIRSLGEEILTHLGFGVTTAATGAEACQRYQEMGHTPVVILDLHLAGENGADVLERLKLLNPQAQVVVASGFFAPEEEARLKAAGAAGFLQKPFRLKDLVARIAEARGGAPETEPETVLSGCRAKGPSWCE
uniref:Response regulator n=1 Tax=Desulfobacca acetoxidans TaxID=60893 RepID=A0A7V4LE47_9BACT